MSEANQLVSVRVNRRQAPIESSRANQDLDGDQNQLLPNRLEADCLVNGGEFFSQHVEEHVCQPL